MHKLQLACMRQKLAFIGGQLILISCSKKNKFCSTQGEDGENIFLVILVASQSL
jgi:hypothetical protein